MAEPWQKGLLIHFTRFFSTGIFCKEIFQLPADGLLKPLEQALVKMDVSIKFLLRNSNFAIA